jgi:hypothetical protein
MAGLQELLEREERAWAALWAHVERIPAGDRDREGVVGDWSTKDVVWHCAYWAAFCGEHLERKGAGAAWSDPFAGQSDEYWDRENQEIADASKAMTWADVETGANVARDRARAALAASDEVDEIAENWFADETFTHYDEHSEHLATFADGLSG